MDLLSDTYYSIGAPSEGIYKELGSRFIALAYPVETEAEVKDLVSGLRKQYHDARHHCYAYRLGLGGTVSRASDDGEPSGSAGRPILGQLLSDDLSDVLVVVVRYFGGIKLGVPGLIRAYKTSTSDALAAAQRISKTAGAWYRIEFPYEAMQEVMSLVKDLGLPQRAQDFSTVCSMEVRVRLSLDADFLERIKNIPNFIFTKL